MDPGNTAFNYISSRMANLPFLILFITEIKQAGNVEKKFNKIMQHQKNKSKMIQAVKRTNLKCED